MFLCRDDTNVGGDPAQEGKNLVEELGGLTYTSYLHLDKILTAQKLESEKDGAKVHDEHLFIVIHQGNRNNNIVYWLSTNPGCCFGVKFCRISKL